MTEDDKAGLAGEAVVRLEAFLRNSVEGPLVDSLGGDDPKELRAGVERALSAIQSLHFLADRAAGERTLYDLEELVSTTVQQFQSGSSLQVDLVLPAEAVQVRVDGDGFSNALTLVLHNAESFGGDRGAKITIEAGDPYATVTVADDGPGFSAEALSRAYDPFYSTSESGLGLGLPQARTLVEAMGGQIHLRNGEKGGVVELSLPLA